MEISLVKTKVSKSIFRQYVLVSLINIEMQNVEAYMVIIENI